MPRVAREIGHFHPSRLAAPKSEDRASGSAYVMGNAAAGQH